MRNLLVGIVILATVGFVVGTSIERHNARHESAAQLRSETAAAHAAEGTSGESAAKHAAEGNAKTKALATAGGGESAAKHAAEGKTPTSTHAPAGETAAHRAAEGKVTTEAPATSTGGESAAKHAAELKGSKAGTVTEQHKELRPLGIDIEAVPFVVLAALSSLVLAALVWLRPRWLVGLVAIAIAMVVFGALDVREVFHQLDENRTGLAVLAGVIAALHFAAASVAVGMAAQRGSSDAEPPAMPA